MENAQTTPPKNSFGCLHVLLIIVILLLITILGSLWWLKRNVYASEFKPVTLNPAEQVVLDAKIKQLETPAPIPATVPVPSSPDSVEPEAYSESAESRRIEFSEKELNALVAGDPEMARHVAIDLTDDLLSVKIIAPMDQDIPIAGGKTFKLNMGLSLSYADGKPSVIIRGISLGGVPLPSAWMGDIKNKNLVEKFGESGGFWDMFSKGVEHLEVKDGRFILHLKE